MVEETRESAIRDALYHLEAGDFPLEVNYSTRRRFGDWLKGVERWSVYVRSGGVKLFDALSTQKNVDYEDVLGGFTSLVGDDTPITATVYADLEGYALSLLDSWHYAQFGLTVGTTIQVDDPVLRAGHGARDGEVLEGVVTSICAGSDFEDPWPITVRLVDRKPIDEYFRADELKVTRLPRSIGMEAVVARAFNTRAARK